MRHRMSRRRILLFAAVSISSRNQGRSGDGHKEHSLKPNEVAKLTIPTTVTTFPAVDSASLKALRKRRMRGFSLSSS